MSTKTTNYNLIKPEYTDTPDITAINPNWDIIDTKLKEAMESGGSSVVGGDYLPLTGGTVTGETTFEDDVNFYNSIHDTLQLKTYTNSGEELVTFFPQVVSGSPEIQIHGNDNGEPVRAKLSIGDPTSDYHAATKGYVDNAIAALEIPTVDDIIAQLSVAEEESF